MTKYILSLGLILRFFSTFAQQSDSARINWPSKYIPGKSEFYVHNEINIAAKPEVVWAVLIDALKWPLWYEGAKNVAFVSQADTVLNGKTVFSWETMGLRFQSTVKQFEPYRVLAWESRKKSIQGFHVWLILPTYDGCKVVTEESQNGWLTFFEKLFQRNKLKRLHDVWLTELKRKAENQN